MRRSIGWVAAAAALVGGCAPMPVRQADPYPPLSGGLRRVPSAHLPPLCFPHAHRGDDH